MDSERKKILTEMLAYIKSKKFTGAEADVERYEKYVKKKGKYIDRLKKLDGITDTYKEVNDREIKQLLRQIIDADNEISEVMLVLFNELKVKSKNSRLNRKLNYGYVPDSYQGRSAFDLKR